MRFPKFSKKLEEQVVRPSLDKVKIIETGTVVKSYFRKELAGVNSTQTSPIVLVDVIITDGEDNITAKYSDVPVPRIFGVQAALPPMGTIALMAYTGKERSNPMVLALYDGVISELQQEDNIVPKAPPRILSK